MAFETWKGVCAERSDRHFVAPILLPSSTNEEFDQTKINFEAFVTLLDFLKVIIAWFLAAQEVERPVFSADYSWNSRFARRRASIWTRTSYIVSAWALGQKS
jgi:hypothetical protein